MILLKLLVFTLTFYDLIVDLDATPICPKGQRVTRDEASCDACPNGFYQSEANGSQHCKVCTKCEEKTGSVFKGTCTKETNTKCQCRVGFVPRDLDFSTCKCDSGFGLRPGRVPECSECEDGYFNPRINSACQKWNECKCGVSRSGTKTSDVICNTESKGCSDASNTYVTPPPTSNKIVSRIPPSTSRRLHEGATTTTTTTTTAAPGHAITKGQSLQTPDTGTAIVILIIVGLLVVLTAVTCKLHITRQPAAQTDDSLCRRPVEESGDDSLSSLKLNPGEH